jgi:uncharacterized integral membrane protein (TIGR00697 family)
MRKDPHMDHWILVWLHYLQQHLSAESLSAFLLLSCIASVLLLLRVAGVAGLWLYSAIATIAANIQVLRCSPFLLWEHPIALGTVLFTSIFWVNDLITEYYGIQYARKNILLCFFSQLCFNLWMLLTIAHPLTTLPHDQQNQQAIIQVFLPSARLLLASISAYITSQWLDITLFSRIKSMTKQRYLWLRQNLAMGIAGFLDNLMFSLCAWMWLQPAEARSWEELWYTYVLSAQCMRMLITLLVTPVTYLSRYCLPRNDYDVCNTRTV